MTTTIFDIFTGEETVNVSFDKFVAKRLPHVREDKVITFEHGKPEHGEAILVLEHGELVDAVFYDYGTMGVYWFQDWDCYRSVYKTDGWCRWSQFE